LLLVRSNVAGRVRAGRFGIVRARERRAAPFLALTVATAALAGLAIVATARAAARQSPVVRDGHGLRVISQRRLSNRLLDVRVSTSALRGPADIFVLLPFGYRQHPRWRYPVLYLLHGAFGDPSEWLPHGIRNTTAGRRVIVVMPPIGLDGDGGGSCTNWVHNGTTGPEQWETFHIHQLLPWVDQNLHTIARHDGRAIAGLSEGGYCAMSYISRHPDLFATAANFSGVTDIAYDKQGQVASGPLITEGAATNGGTSDSIYGDPATDEVNWHNHDPASLADNLRGENLLIYYGSGKPGPYDSSPAPDPTEASVAYDNGLFHNRLEALHIGSYWDYYGPGTHTWPYWERDLRWSMPRIMAGFAHPRSASARVTYTIADASYTVYGWHVALRRKAEEFSTLKNAGEDGFTLMGSGSASVTTPRRYTPHASYVVVLRGKNIARSIVMRANAGGHLQVTVPLGPANAGPPYSSGWTPADTRVYTTHVSIARAVRRAPRHGVSR
jgi:S-formylglutathione hydrolase FrmB